MDTLAVFRSRSDALKIYNLLRKQKLACTTVSTPAKLGVGCGISVLFPSFYTEEVRRLITLYSIASFVGFYQR